jgi:hypothetical protein
LASDHPPVLRVLTATQGNQLTRNGLTRNVAVTLRQGEALHD